MTDKKKATHDRRHGGSGKYIKPEDAEQLDPTTWVKEKRWSEKQKEKKEKDESTPTDSQGE